jgi:hypothetical protein
MGLFFMEFSGKIALFLNLRRGAWPQILTAGKRTDRINLTKT